MKINRTKYAIITKDRPTEFLTGTGELSDRFDDAYLCEDLKNTSDVLDTLNEPEKFIVIPVTLTVEV